MVAQQSELFGLSDSSLKALDGQGVFCPDVYQSDACPDAVSADGHCLDDGIGVSFHDGTVHKCSRVSFVCIADHIFLIRLVFAGKFPF